MTQLSLFGDENNNELAVPQLNSNIRTVVLNGIPYVSVIDLFKYHSKAKNPHQTWNTTLANLIEQNAVPVDWGGSPNFGGLRIYKFEGKGQKETPIATELMVMRIAQSAKLPEWEGIRAMMARLGAEENQRKREPQSDPLQLKSEEKRLIAAKVEQGFSPEEARLFILIRREGIATRNQWTDALKAVVRGAIAGYHYSTATNTEYQGLFQRTAKDLSAETGFSTARDGLTLEARSILTAAEIVLEKRLRMHETITFAQAIEIVKDVCSTFRIPIAQAEQQLGIDFATGKPLLPSGSKQRG